MLLEIWVINYKGSEELCSRMASKNRAKFERVKGGVGVGFGVGAGVGEGVGAGVAPWFQTWQPTSRPARRQPYS